MLRAGERHGNRLSAAGAHHGLARFLGGLQQVELFALALIQHRDDARGRAFLFAVAQQLAGR